MAYSLQWANHQAMLSSAVQNCAPDVTLVCGDVHIPANSLVLSASSSLLYSLLKEAPPSSIMISLPDTNHGHLHALFSFLQTGELQGSKADLDQVLATAEYLQMTCFSSQQKTESEKQISSSSGNIESEPREVSTEKEESLCMPNESVEIISEEEYRRRRRRMVATSLKKVSEQDGRTSLKCDICGKKWVGNVCKDRRRAVRHMGLHLQVRVRCSVCGGSLKSVESFYFHRIKCCKNKAESQADSVDKARGEENDDNKVVDKEDLVEDDTMNSSYHSGKRETDLIDTLRNDDEDHKLEEDMAKVNNDWYCLICGKFWHVKAKCRRHMVTHFPCKLPCAICGKMFSSKYLLQKHENSCHGEGFTDSVIVNKPETKSIQNGQTKTNIDENADQSTIERNIDEANNYQM